VWWWAEQNLIGRRHDERDGADREGHQGLELRGNGQGASLFSRPKDDHERVRPAGRVGAASNRRGGRGGADAGEGPVGRDDEYPTDGSHSGGGQTPRPAREDLSASGVHRGHVNQVARCHGRAERAAGRGGPAPRQAEPQLSSA